MTGIYRFANKKIRIDSIYKRVHILCAKYACGGDPDIVVETCPADIEYERAMTDRSNAEKGVETPDFSDPYLETLAVYRKIAEQMPDHGVVLFHGSCVSVDGVCYIFSAKSGTGKSTHAQLWLELLGKRAFIVNDDKPLIGVDEYGVTVYGTPYSGKHRLDRNTSAPLRALCMLSRSAKNSIITVTPQDIFPDLLSQVYHPDDPGRMAKTVSIIADIAEKVNLFRLYCNMDIEAARVAYDAMSK